MKGYVKRRVNDPKENDMTNKTALITEVKELNVAIESNMDNQCRIVGFKGTVDELLRTLRCRALDTLKIYRIGG